MAEESYPFDVGQGAGMTAPRWRAMARHWRKSGVNKGDQNSLAVTAGSGMQVLVASGSAFVRGPFYNNSASLPLPVGAADATFGRLDLVCLELDLSDLNAPKIEAMVVPGTPSGSPALPALTQNSTIHQIPLYSVTVPALASSLSTFTDYRPYSGNQPRMFTNSGATASTSSTTYADILEMTTGSMYSDGGDLDVVLTMSTSNNSAGQLAFIAFSLDGGGEVYIGRAMSDSANQVIPFHARYLFENISAGFHTIKARWLVTAGTQSSDNSRRMIVTEVGR